MDAVIRFVRRVIPPTETDFSIPITWVLSGASVDMDFVNNRYWNDPNLDVNPASLLSISRASIGYATTSAGLLVQFSSDTLRITDLGLLVEDSRTNEVLWNRDLTNAAWTPTNMNRAKDQTGPDGVASSASSITATAGNATILQSITLVSSARYQSAYVKRITGSGTVEMTMDNGATWTAITVTASWGRATIPTQTLANPTVGFRIVTSGDAIAVDFVQNEGGPYPTSPIPTTTTSAVRAFDNIHATGGLSSTLNNSQASFYCNIDITPRTQVFFLYFDDNNSLNFNSATQLLALASGVQIAAVLGASHTWQANQNKAALAWNGSGRSICADGGTISTDSNIVVTSANPAILSYNGTLLPLDSYCRRLTVWNSRLSDAAIQTLTIP